MHGLEDGENQMTLESARSATHPADGIGMVPGWCKMCRSSKITINLGYVDL
jgi:hypothetical protein